MAALGPLMPDQEPRGGGARPTGMRGRLLLSEAILAAAGCSGNMGAIVGHTGGPRADATHSTDQLVCGRPSAEYAWAEQVTLAGVVRWRTPLAEYAHLAGPAAG